MIRLSRIFGLLATALIFSNLPLPSAVRAHEVRPAYLEIQEIFPDQFTIIWRTPVLSGMRLPVVLKLSNEVKSTREPVVQVLPDSLIERRWIEAPTGLAGKRIDFVGLQATITDVLVRVQFQDGSYLTQLVHPSQPWIEIPASHGTLMVMLTYLRHGFEHILLGYDHLLFVFALMLIVNSTRVLLLTITAFTIAHSITLALAALKLVTLPAAPVESAIVLSILLLAYEITRVRRGETTLTFRKPWIVAFAFGLLHGFGFAGALTSVGLPQSDLPLALFAFNVGVELGQIAFIAVVLSMIALLKRIRLPVFIERHALSFTTYTIGILAAFWFFERLANIGLE